MAQYNRKKKSRKAPAAPKKNRRSLTKPTKKRAKQKQGGKVHVRVSRFNPTMDFVSRTHPYEMAVHPGESVFDVLRRIKEHHDGSLAFRGSCGYGKCGACGVKVNGQPVLACVTQARDYITREKTIRIDPLHENMLKDLVVDETDFFNQFLRVKPWLVPRKDEMKRKHKMTKKDVQKLGSTQNCIMCSICNSHAQSQETIDLGPAAFVKGYQYAMDIRDGDALRMRKLASKPAHYSLEAANKCPRDIYPGKKIRAIKKEMKTKKKPVR